MIGYEDDSAYKGGHVRWDGFAGDRDNFLEVNVLVNFEPL